MRDQQRSQRRAQCARNQCGRRKKLQNVKVSAWPEGRHSALTAPAGLKRARPSTAPPLSCGLFDFNAEPKVFLYKDRPSHALSPLRTARVASRLTAHGELSFSQQLTTLSIMAANDKNQDSRGRVEKRRRRRHRLVSWRRRAPAATAASDRSRWQPPVAVATQWSTRTFTSSIRRATRRSTLRCSRHIPT